MSVLNLSAGLIYIVSIIFIFLSLKKKNYFWVYFLFIEYFYLFGLGVFPFFLALDMLKETENIKIIPSIATPTHIIFYVAGALFGFYCKKEYVSASFSRYIIKKRFNALKSFYFFLFIFFLFYSMYIFVVGFEESILGASYARVGEFDYFGSDAKYTFLMRPMLLGVLISFYAVYFMCFQKKPFRYLVLCILVGLLIYTVTLSRYVLLQLIVLPMFLYSVIYFKHGVIHKISIALVFIIGTIFAILVFLYGKFILPQIYLYFMQGVPLTLDLDGFQGNNFGAFSHLYFSIDAGIKSFFGSGLILFPDVYLSILGIFPSSFFEVIGLKDLSYHYVSASSSFSCHNTYYITFDYQCYIPPYYTGASAYTFPLVGGFLFGFIRFYIYSLFSKAWSLILDEKRINGNKDIPFLLIIFYLIEQFMHFIPATISMSVFMLLLLLFVIKFYKVKVSKINS